MENPVDDMEFESWWALNKYRITEDKDIDLRKIAHLGYTGGKYGLFKVLEINASLAMLNATLIEFVCEVADGPYKDSDARSLLIAQAMRAKTILKELERKS